MSVAVLLLYEPDLHELEQQAYPEGIHMLDFCNSDLSSGCGSNLQHRTCAELTP